MLACIRIRRKRYVLDYRDQAGKRRWRSFPFTDAGLEAAEAAKARLEALRPGSVDPSIAVGPYLEYWLELVSTRVNPGTLIGYAQLRSLIPGPLWRARVADLNRPTIKAWIVSIAKAGYKRGTVKRFLGIMRTMLTEAVDDGLLSHNPASGLGRSLGLDEHKRALDDVRAMDADQLDAFMACAQVTEAELFPFFAMLGYAGLRSGEARGIELDDLDIERRRIYVRRQVYMYGGIGLPKGEKTRTLVMSEHLAGILRTVIPALREYHLRTGRRSPWLLFPEFSPEPTKREVAAAVARVRLAMARVLKRAKITGHFTPHCLRHTYATIQLSRGESLLFVARQLGDTMQITAEVYGRWAPVPPTAGGPNLLSPKKPEKKTLGRED